MQEKGPWRVIREGQHDVAIMSDDFTHDVILSISGDFTDDAQRSAYAELIAKRLNRLCSRCSYRMDDYEGQCFSCVAESNEDAVEHHIRHAD